MGVYSLSMRHRVATTVWPSSCGPPTSKREDLQSNLFGRKRFTFNLEGQRFSATSFAQEQGAEARQ